MIWRSQSFTDFTLGQPPGVDCPFESAGVGDQITTVSGLAGIW